LVTAALEDANTQRAALFLAMIAGLEEAFRVRSRTMEFELPRIMPVILKLHQRTAQFLEEALAKCFKAIVSTIPPRRFVSLLLVNSDSKSPKVQTAAAKYCRESLHRCVQEKERLFLKNSNEAADLVKMIWKFLSGSIIELQ
jgi:hypothetical protein